MGISTRQYQDIMNEYDAVRRRNSVSYTHLTLPTN